MLVNTSFNVRGEPIVCTPEDAYRCFLATEMDALVLEDVILLKKDVAGHAGRRRRARSTWRSSSWIEDGRCSGLTSSSRRPQKMLRQFAGLFLVVFLGLAGWRVWRGQADQWAAALAALAVVVGVVGLVRPSAVRLIYTGWMIVAFPIGWTISRVALAIVFYGVITPVALFFKLTGRDELRLRRAERRASYWKPKPGPEDVREYFRQS